MESSKPVRYSCFLRAVSLADLAADSSEDRTGQGDQGSLEDFNRLGLTPLHPDKKRLPPELYAGVLLVAVSPSDSSGDDPA